MLTRQLSQHPGWRDLRCTRGAESAQVPEPGETGCGAIRATGLIAPVYESRAPAGRKCRELRNASTRLALMCVEKIMEIRDACSSRSGCRGGVDKFRHSFVLCERGGSVRPNLCRASMRRKLHPFPRRDSREGHPRARCDNRGASACARTGCGNQERTAPRR